MTSSVEYLRTDATSRFLSGSDLLGVLYDDHGPAIWLNELIDRYGVSDTCVEACAFSSPGRATQLVRKIGKNSIAASVAPSMEALDHSKYILQVLIPENTDILQLDHFAERHWPIVSSARPPLMMINGGGVMSLPNKTMDQYVREYMGGVYEIVDNCQNGEVNKT